MPKSIRGEQGNGEAPNNQEKKDGEHPVNIIINNSRGVYVGDLTIVGSGKQLPIASSSSGKKASLADKLAYRESLCSQIYKLREIIDKLKKYISSEKESPMFFERTIRLRDKLKDRSVIIKEECSKNNAAIYVEMITQKLRKKKNCSAEKINPIIDKLNKNGWLKNNYEINLSKIEFVDNSEEFEELSKNLEGITAAIEKKKASVLQKSSGTSIDLLGYMMASVLEERELTVPKSAEARSNNSIPLRDSCLTPRERSRTL